MKKALVLALVVSFVLSLAGTALAFPVDFTGDFRLQARSVDDNITGGDAYKKSYFGFRARLGFEGKVDDGTSFYGRFTTRINRLGEAGDDAGATGQLDQFGLKIKTDNWNFKVGRQAVNLGQGTLISTGNDAAGVDNKFDGLVASTKMGKVDVNIIGGKTTNASAAYVTAAHTFVAPEAAQWYGMDLSTKFDDKFSAGLAYVSRKGDTNVYSADAIKAWAVNAAFNATPNFTLNGEYAKSNMNTANKAYFLAGTYSWDKDSFTVQYQKVNINAVDPINSGIGYGAYGIRSSGLDLGDPGYKGMTYAYNHAMSKTTSFHIVYMDLKADGVVGADKEIMTGVVWKF